jgi:chemotaxis protein MotA
MDIASLIGVVIGTVCFGLVAYETSHGHFMMFYSLEGVLCVFGGSISVCFMSMPMEKVKCVFGFLRRFMFQKGQSTADVIELLKGFSEKSRRDGVLALESDRAAAEQADPFLATGLRLLIDGIDPVGIEKALRLEILAMQDRHKAGKKFFDLIKLYGPGWGLVGTLVGQIGMFGNLGSGDAGTLGKSLAVAVCATMYGTVLANAIAGPIGDKLAIRSTEEMLGREMILQGLLSIQAGDNPRVTMDKVIAFLPMPARERFKAAA